MCLAWDLKKKTVWRKKTEHCTVGSGNSLKKAPEHSAKLIGNAQGEKGKRRERPASATRRIGARVKKHTAEKTRKGSVWTQGGGRVGKIVLLVNVSLTNPGILNQASLSKGEGTEN